MIDKNAIETFVAQRLEGTDYFPVSVTVSAANEIKVEIDSMESVDIDFCVALSREIEEAFPRDDEDYELEVGSAGLTSPFKVARQYEKNIGNEVETLTRDGKKLRGVLISADNSGFQLEVAEKVKKEGEKRPVTELRTIHFNYDDVKYTKYLLQF